MLCATVVSAEYCGCKDCPLSHETPSEGVLKHYTEIAWLNSNLKLFVIEDSISVISSRYHWCTVFCRDFVLFNQLIVCACVPQCLYVREYTQHLLTWSRTDNVRNPDTSLRKQSWPMWNNSHLSWRWSQSGGSCQQVRFSPWLDSNTKICFCPLWCCLRIRYSFMFWPYWFCYIDRTWLPIAASKIMLLFGLAFRFCKVYPSGQLLALTSSLTFG